MLDLVAQPDESVIKRLRCEVLRPDPWIDGLALRDECFKDGRAAGYIRTFDAETARAKNSRDLIDAMKQGYPG